jgi:hypothetical protein
MQLPPERLGSFYLGAEYDAQRGAHTGVPIVYDARHLTTHALCIGMTGSGKTGLCLGLLEEAALDNVPAILVDPKATSQSRAAISRTEPQDFAPGSALRTQAYRKKPSQYAARLRALERRHQAWGSPERLRTLKSRWIIHCIHPAPTPACPSISWATWPPRPNFDECRNHPRAHRRDRECPIKLSAWR